MKFIWLVICGFFPLAVNGQTDARDSLLLDLTSRMIDSFDMLNGERIKIMKSVTIPTEVWDEQSKKPRTGSYFSPDDLESISQQVQNPAIETWNVSLIRKKKKVNFVTRVGRRECLLISLPIVSKDGRTVVIYYRSMSKRSGAGFVTVWRKTNQGAWTKDKDAMLWITDLKNDNRPVLAAVLGNSPGTEL